MLSLIFTIIGSLVPTILQQSGVIGSGTQNLITSLLGPVEQLIAGLKAGTGKTSDALAALATISGVIAVLKAQTGLPADVLTQIDNIEKDIAAALKAYVVAGAGLNLSLYSPITPV